MEDITLKMDNMSLIKKEEKKSKIGKVILIIVVAIILIWFIAVTAISSVVKNKLAKIDIQQLDINQLGINNNMYDEVSNFVSKEEFDSIKNIALFGIDEERSDTIIIASINQTKHTIKLIDVPSNTYVSVDGHNKTSLNNAYTYGQETLALNTINKNFGLNISKYITINFEGLTDIINEVEGIELDITQEEMEYINNNSDEVYSKSEKEKKLIDNYGKVMLDGEQALTYSRYSTSEEEISGENRQVKVITSLAEKIAKLGTSKIWSLSDSILSKIKTNIDIEKSVETVEKVLSYSSEYLNNFEFIQIPSEEEYGSGKKEEIDGVYYFVADLDKVKEVLKNEIYISEDNQ